MAIRKSLLPSAYQQVEYIESSGTQYIDTGVIGGNTVGYDLSFVPTNVSGDNAYIGVRESTNTASRFTLGSNTNGLYAGFNDLTYYQYQGQQPRLTDGTKYNVKVNLNNDRQFVLDGNVGSNNFENLTLATITKNIFVFCANWGGSPNYFQSSKLYSLIITDGTTLVRNFIPCYRKADSVIGLYDTVNSVFYTNAGSGTFTKGNDVMPKVKKLIKNNDYVIRAYKGSSLYYNALPSEFKAVEYIESSGLEYIDTGVIPTNNTEVSADFIVVNFNSNVVNYMFGNYEAGKLFALYRNTSDIFGVMFSNYDNFSSYEIQLDTRYKAKLNSTGAYINGSSIKSFTTLPDFTATNSLYIFKGNGSSRPPAILKLYGFTIKESNKVIRKLIPCYRISDTTIGLYDLVNGVFYTNAGTGAFTKGSDI